MASVVTRRKAAAENAAALGGTMREINGRMPEWSASTETDLRHVIGLGEAFDKAVDAAEADPGLSPTGVHAAITRAGTVALAALSSFERSKIGVFRERIAGIERSIAGKVAPPRAADVGEAVVREMRARETRDLVRGLAPSEALAIFLSSSDPEVVAALSVGYGVTEGAGGTAVLRPLIPDEARSAALAVRAEAAAPEEALMLSKLTAVARLYGEFVGSARAAIVEMVPALRPAPEPETLGSQQK
jgi:hypothetical protein